LEELAELHRFNAWANRNLLGAIDTMTPQQLDERLDGMYNSVLGVLRHLAWVEFIYVAMIRGDVVERPAQPWSLDEAKETLAGTGQALVEIARSFPGDATFHIPWFERDVTVFQGLGQVLTHSMNHRADINQWLPRFGVESIDDSYIDLVLSEPETGV
jgi:uncharacterized damage-inducible protein DinB